MSKKVFFIECSAPFWIDVARNLLSELDLEPVYWTSINYYKSDILKTFPSCTFHSCNDAKVAKNPPFEKGTIIHSFDKAEIDIWITESQTYYDMVGRFDYSRDFSFYERSELFYKQLLYWSTVLANKKPDLVVFPNAPHGGYDYLIYRLCKKYDIPVILFDEMTIDMYSYAQTNFEEGPQKLKQVYQLLLTQCLQEGRSPVLSSSMKEYVNRVKGTYEQGIPISEYNFRKVNKNKEKLKKYFDTLIGFFKHDYATWRQKNPIDHSWITSVFKEKNAPLAEAYRGHFGKTRFYLEYFNIFADNKLRYRLYESLSVKPDLKSKYVYVSLAGQPERTSCPQGGVFSNQYLMVHTVASALPDGWRVYVKEHPNHFITDFWPHVCRRQSFYKEIAAIPKVSWVPISSDPFTMIDHAQAVVSIAGTASWEAVLRGKPGIIFGDARYKFCEGIFRVANLSDCQSALNRIGQGYQVNTEAVLCFLEAVEKACFVGNSDPLPPWYTITNEENARSITKEILEIIDLNYQCIKKQKDKGEQNPASKTVARIK